MTVRVGARVAIALLALLPAGLSGCGQTGPLYLPDDDGATVITRPGPATTGPTTETPGASDTAPPVPTDKPPARR